MIDLQDTYKTVKQERYFKKMRSKKNISDEQKRAQEIVSQSWPEIGRSVSMWEQDFPDASANILPIVKKLVVEKFEAVPPDQDHVEIMKALKSTNEEFANKVWIEFCARYTFRNLKWSTPEQAFAHLKDLDTFGHETVVRVFEMLMENSGLK